MIATCRTESDKDVASRAGADEVFLTDGNLVDNVGRVAPGGIDHIVEVAFAANIKTDIQVVKQGGSIATYATDRENPQIPISFSSSRSASRLAVWSLTSHLRQILMHKLDCYGPLAHAGSHPLYRAVAHIPHRKNSRKTGFE